MKKISLLAFTASLAALSATAEAKGTYILSINGVNNNRAKAESNMDAIERDIVIPNRVSIESSKDPIVDFVHNQTSGLGTDLVDVWLEKSAEQALRLSQGFFSVGPLPQELGDAIRRRAELAQQINEQAWGSDADLRIMVDRSVERMKAGDRVFLMPHSQGNLYANRVFNGIFERLGIPDMWKESVGISGVASAASYVSSPFGQYVTSSTDVVIGALNAIRGTLPANITLPISSADFTGYGLQEIYLANPSSKNIISANAVFLGRNVKYPGTVIADLSAAASDSAALADLINDSNNLSPMPVEPGKSLYLEGSGLGGAQFEIPGVTGRISAASVNLPTDHPLYVAGSEVWKLTIPANAIVGSSGVIRAIISVDGVEQSFDSPRSVVINGSFDWEIRRKGYALNPNEPVQIGDFLHTCPNVGGQDDYFRKIATGFVGTVFETVQGVSQEYVSPFDSGFNRTDSSFCAYVRVNVANYSDGQVMASMLDPHTWETRYQAKYYNFGSQQNIDYFSTEAWNVEGYIKQVRLLDGQCDRITYRSKCVTQTNRYPATGEFNEGTSCPWTVAPRTQIVACKARPDASDHRELWQPEGSQYLMQPDYSASPVTIEPVLRLQMNSTL